MQLTAPKSIEYITGYVIGATGVGATGLRAINVDFICGSINLVILKKLAHDLQQNLDSEMLKCSDARSKCDDSEEGIRQLAACYL